MEEKVYFNKKMCYHITYLKNDTILIAGRGQRMDTTINKTIGKKLLISTIALLIIMAIVFCIPLHNASKIQENLTKHKRQQIQYINNNIQIVPEIINISKGYIIHNGEALKDIIHINVLTKTNTDNIGEIYANQMQIINITKNLLDKAEKNSLLSHNKRFVQLNEKFKTLYQNATTGYSYCREYSNKLAKYLSLPVYKNIIKIKNLNEVVCTQDF